MSNLTCPKCGGSDSFVSQRNIVKGRGIFVSGKMRSVAVCRACDEIMRSPITIETQMPTSKMSASELKKFYLPHAILLLITLLLSVIQSAFSSIAVTLFLQINVIALVTRLVIRKRRGRGIY
jgi:hypothetical protein